MLQTGNNRVVHSHKPKHHSKKRLNVSRPNTFKPPGQSTGWSLRARFVAIFVCFILCLLGAAVYLFEDIIIHSEDEVKKHVSPPDSNTDFELASLLDQSKIKGGNVISALPDIGNIPLTNIPDQLNDILEDFGVAGALRNNDNSDNNNGQTTSSILAQATTIDSVTYPTDINSINIDSNDFYYLLHRRWFGFSDSEYIQMANIIGEYAEYHTRVLKSDLASVESGGKIQGKYIILSPSAQMCNRLRAFMGAFYLGIVTRRLVFIDISKEGYAARLDGVFMNPGFTWELSKMPGKIRNGLKSASSKRLSFPYEGNGAQQTRMTCFDWNQDSGTHVWNLDSLAAFLPVIGRNMALAEGLAGKSASVHKQFDFDKEYNFDEKLLEHFGYKNVQSSNDIYQENFERLEVLMGRILYRIDDGLQKRVDTFIDDTYTKAIEYYKSQGIKWDIETKGPPPVIGIHIRSEYVLSMNLPKGKGGIAKMKDEYKWFEDCGKLIVDQSIIPSNGNNYKDIKYFIFLAADTPHAQNFGIEVFGRNRVHFQKFVKTGATLDGIKDAVVDLVTVASFDGFVSTPHSSYSEMASILGQPRRVINPNTKKFEFVKKLAGTQGDYRYWNRLAVNRPIVPMMTHTEWEIKKLNKYMYGRGIDINLNVDVFSNKLVPLTQKVWDSINFSKDNVCKQTLATGMGWMGMFHMFKAANCYNANYHHPSKEWFPYASK